MFDRRERGEAKPGMSTAQLDRSGALISRSGFCRQRGRIDAARGWIFNPAYSGQFAAHNACGVAEAAVSGGNPVSKISRIHRGSSGHVSALELTTDRRSMTVNEKTPGKAKS